MRNEAQAIGGFYATPPVVIPMIAALCRRQRVSGMPNFTVIDPCAAEGDAAAQFSRALFGDIWQGHKLYACELEATRARRLVAREKEKGDYHGAELLKVIHGDAFAVEWLYEPDYQRCYGSGKSGGSVLWLNPPYSVGVMERRFLERYTATLKSGGVLIYIVPFYALDKSAEILSRNYTIAGCYKFPEPLFSETKDQAFRQVVLFGVRHETRDDPDERDMMRLRRWSGHPEEIPVLPAQGMAPPIVEIPSRSGFCLWAARPVDVEALIERFVPLYYTDRANVLREIPGVVPGPARELLRRRYEVVSPLKPAHIATAIAAGVFNGARITADDPESGWPDLLVKGVFNREFREVDEKVDHNGVKKASVKVQQPRLFVTVLDLSTKQYHTLVDSDEETEATTVDRITTADLLAIYGSSLLRVMLENCPPMHDPLNPAHEIQIAPVARPLYRAQAHATMAAVKLLGGVEPTQRPRRRRGGWKLRAYRQIHRGRAAVILGEVGSGKSSISLATAKTIAAPIVERGGTYRLLVFCPPHLLKSWRDQAAAVVPEARVRVLESIFDVDDEARDMRSGMSISILSRSIAKLGHAWQGVEHARHLMNVVERVGFGFSPARRSRSDMTLRLAVQKIAPDVEVWAGVEVCHDGIEWINVASFEPTEQTGEQTIRVTTSGAKYVRIAYSLTGAATFGVLEDMPNETTCPRCGALAPKCTKVGVTQKEWLATSRECCAHVASEPIGILGRAARTLARVIYPAAPHAWEVQHLMPGRFQKKIVGAASRRVPSLEQEKPSQVAADNLAAAWARVRPRHELREVLDAMIRARMSKRGQEDDIRKRLDPAILTMCAAIGDKAVIGDAAVKIYGCELSLKDRGCFLAGGHLRALARDLLLLLPPDVRAVAEKPLRDFRIYDKPDHSGAESRWHAWEGLCATIDAGGVAVVHGHDLTLRDGRRGAALTWHGHDVGDLALTVQVLAQLLPLTTWQKGPVCGERLYEAVADPKRGGRRYPLSKYILRRHRDLFDLLVQDESHELAAEDSAQAHAGYRLAAAGMPILDLTGSAMGGYAEALFNRQIALDPQMREEFTREQRSQFVSRYGYVKVLEQDVDRDTGEIVAYGTTSDRIERKVRVLAPAPGVLPLFLLRYLLRVSVVLHKVDLKLELPPCREIPVQIDAGPLLKAGYMNLHERLTEQILDDRTDPVLAGKLWGAAAHLPDYPDLATADTGNVASGVFRGAYEIRYPDSPELGGYRGVVVVRQMPLPKGDIMPKEQWMIDTVRAELAEGRRCMVLGVSVVLLPRLRRLLSEALGEPVALLDVKQVPTEKREEWINTNVVEPGVRVLIVNPVAIQTGLNPLVHFATEIWMQNPSCNAIVYRQAVGRVDRIGQKVETRIYMPTYNLAACEAANTLLMHKVSVSLATDGLDASGALAAAGVSSESGRLDGFAVGKMIFEIMNGTRVFKSRKHAGQDKPKRVRRAAAKAA